MNAMDKVSANLSANQKVDLLAHFNTIYASNFLSVYEHRIIYLAWLSKSKYVYKLDKGFYTFDKKYTGIGLNDLEISIVVNQSGGINLETVHNFYNLE